jgi:hypothetical protein
VRGGTSRRCECQRRRRSAAARRGQGASRVSVRGVSAGVHLRPSAGAIAACASRTPPRRLEPADRGGEDLVCARRASSGRHRGCRRRATARCGTRQADPLLRTTPRSPHAARARAAARTGVSIHDPHVRLAVDELLGACGVHDCWSAAPALPQPTHDEHTPRARRRAGAAARMAPPARPTARTFRAPSSCGPWGVARALLRPRRPGAHRWPPTPAGAFSRRASPDGIRPHPVRSLRRRNRRRSRCVAVDVAPLSSIVIAGSWRTARSASC